MTWTVIRSVKHGSFTLILYINISLDFFNDHSGWQFLVRLLEDPILLLNSLPGIQQSL